MPYQKYQGPPIVVRQILQGHQNRFLSRKTFSQLIRLFKLSLSMACFRTSFSCFLGKVILSRDVPVQRSLSWDFCSCPCPRIKGQWDVPSFGNPSPWVPCATLFLSPSSTQHYKTRATSFKGIVQFPNRLYSGVGGYNSPLVPQALTTNALFRSGKEAPQRRGQS